MDMRAFDKVRNKKDCFAAPLPPVKSPKSAIARLKKSVYAMESEESASHHLIIPSFHHPFECPFVTATTPTWALAKMTEQQVQVQRQLRLQEQG